MTFRAAIKCVASREVLYWINKYSRRKVLIPPLLNFLFERKTFRILLLTISFLPVFALGETVSNLYPLSDRSNAAALKAAGLAAAHMQRTLIIDHSYIIASDVVLVNNVVFGQGGAFVVEAGAMVTLRGEVYAANTIQIFFGPGIAVVATAPFVSVAWWGALAAASKRTDAAAAFRAAVGSNRVYYVPPGNYLFASYVQAHIGTVRDGSQTVGAAVQFKNQTAFTVSAYGATFSQSNSVPYGNLSVPFFLDSNSNFTFAGADFVGDVKARPKNTSVAALVNHNAVNFVVRDLHLTGNFGSAYNNQYGDGIAADYNVNGLYDNIDFDHQGVAFDTAYLQTVRINNANVVCGDDSDPTKPGRAAYSNTHDVTGPGFNTTGRPIPDTYGVIVSNSRFVNCFYTVLLYSGSNISFLHNEFRGSRSGPFTEFKGYGVWFDYVQGGAPRMRLHSKTTPSLGSIMVSAFVMPQLGWAALRRLISKAPTCLGTT